MFPLFVPLMEGFCWNAFQLLNNCAHLDIIKGTKMAPVQVAFEAGK
jgi:hypothetical protein